MIYLRNFESHEDYEKEKLVAPNVAYDTEHVHYLKITPSSVAILSIFGLEAAGTRANNELYKQNLYNFNNIDVAYSTEGSIYGVYVFCSANTDYSFIVSLGDGTKYGFTSGGAKLIDDAYISEIEAEEKKEELDLGLSRYMKQYKGQYFKMASKVE